MIKTMTLAALLLLPTFTTPATSSNLNKYQVKEVVITAKRVKKEKKIKTSNFFGFKMLAKVNTKIQEKLELAMANWTGPTAGITSMRRGNDTGSPHQAGRAIDFGWDMDVIDYLVSEDGQKWLSAYQLKFFIEGRPGSKRVTELSKIEKYQPYIFFNPNARGSTGDHVHLQLI